MDDRLREIARVARSSTDASQLASLARSLERRGELEAAASAWDAAFGRDPDDDGIARGRAETLEKLTIREHGFTFRYLPAGSFLMGSEAGDPDERPVHRVELSAFWIADVPISWDDHARLLGWPAPPNAYPPDDEPDLPERATFYLHQENKIRLQYCEDRTTQAVDWHAHSPDWPIGDAPRAGDAPLAYSTKPMVSASWQEAEFLAARLSTDQVTYRLPSEAEWEKAARGGRIGARYPWGDAPPRSDRCDFDHFGSFRIEPSRRFPPNGYGLHAMSGGVWEWTRDGYDAQAYADRVAASTEAAKDPVRPQEHGLQRVLRGGSWADCAAACTVSFRTTRGSSSWRTAQWGQHMSPNIGFRLCRVQA